MKRWLPFLIPFTVVLAAGLAAYAIVNRDAFVGPPGPPVQVSGIDALDPREAAYVTVPGMAHYAAVVKQEYPGSLVREARVLYLFGLFRPYDTENRAIRVLVRTSRPPEELVSYEFVKVTGRLAAATPEQVPYEVEITLGKQSDYFFADDLLLLDADHVESWSPDAESAAPE